MIVMKYLKITIFFILGNDSVGRQIIRLPNALSGVDIKQKCSKKYKAYPLSCFENPSRGPLEKAA
jgi:hypothetical protein